ncbi:hypothetical protein MBCUT_13850 [Methanobrevibacter cuticularis]|uniref:DUF4013 domain-containing protein n=1 Tax=Methanobrevibacter cuticularis TaxID=47311 RepID=A0A166DIX6_9EURY|nr:DUF4013 domain-containing protein [Methanobrevibacter cuticularis]KZX15645.1 hypothetical protein MBCUT_13850 [Methanobrevibacter cuticularis]
MILEIFAGSFEYTFKNKKAIGSILKVGILSILSFLILPMLLMYGFSYRIIIIGLTGNISYTNDSMPDFNNIGRMLYEGLKVLLVNLIYFLPTIAITTIIVFHDRPNINFNNLSSFTINFGFSSTLIAILLSFISFIFISTAIPHMINNNGSFRYAFKIKDLIKLIKYTGIVNYLKFFIISLVLFIIFTITAFIISQFLIILIAIVHIAIYSIDLTASTFGYLNIIMFLICYLFSIGIYSIIESRIISFIYNEDGLEE